MSSDYNLSKVLLEFVGGMKKVILDLEALIENHHPVCSESFGSHLKENKDPAQQDKTEKDKTEKDNTEQDATELGNDSQAESIGNRKRPCPKE